MKRFLLFFASFFAGFLALALVVMKLAHADGSGSGSAGSGSGSAIAGDSGSGLGSQAVPAGSGSGSAVTPADKLHDPISSPSAAFDDLKAAKHLGWPAFFFALVLALAKLLAAAGRMFPKIGFLKKFDEGRRAVIVAGVLALAAAGYNAAFAGGAAVAIVTALVTAGLAFYNSQSQSEAK